MFAAAKRLIRALVFTSGSTSSVLGVKITPKSDIKLRLTFLLCFTLVKIVKIKSRLTDLGVNFTPKKVGVVRKTCRKNTQIWVK